MRISGFFKGNAPYILFNMRTEKPQTLRKIPFLIDTGSDIMGVALKDRVSMDISFHCAGRRVGSISGLKEKARRGEINGEPRAITLMKFLTILQAMKYEKGRLAGTLLSIAALQWFFSVMVAEGLHRGFLVSANQWIPYSNQIHYVSELGIEPTAPIFNISTIVLGVMMMGASSLLHLQDKSKLLPSLLAISGIGAIGVGLFPTDIQPTHGIFQAFALLCGAFSAIVSYRTQEPPPVIHLSGAWDSIVCDLNRLLPISGIRSQRHINISWTRERNTGTHRHLYPYPLDL